MIGIADRCAYMPSYKPFDVVKRLFVYALACYGAAENRLTEKIN